MAISSAAVIREGSSASSSWLGKCLRFTGNYFPLRDLAGLAIDIGVPGSDWLRDTLDHREAEKTKVKIFLFHLKASLGEGVNLLL